MEIENIDQSIAVLVNSAKVAYKRGAFELEEAAVINKAIDFLKSQVDQGEQKEQPESKKSK